MAHDHNHNHNHCESCSHEHLHEHEHDHHNGHCHCHEHHGHEHHEHDTKSTLIKIGVTALLLAVAVYIEKSLNLPTWQLLLMYLVPYLLIGHETLKEAAEGLAHGDAFNEHSNDRRTVHRFLAWR